MKNSILLLLLSITQFIYSQTIAEPEWSGEAIFVNDSTWHKLEAKKAYIKASAGAAVYLTGVGKVKTRIMVPENKSDIRIAKTEDLEFIINSGQNDINPNSIIHVVKLNTDKKNKRYYISGESGTFTGVKTGDLDLVEFKAKKYGETSYLINVPEITPGEYALIVNNSYDWNLFGID